MEYIVQLERVSFGAQMRAHVLFLFIVDRVFMPCEIVRPATITMNSCCMEELFALSLRYYCFAGLFQSLRIHGYNG